MRMFFVGMVLGATMTLFLVWWVAMWPVEDYTHEELFRRYEVELIRCEDMLREELREKR